MSTYIQSDRSLAVSTPLGPDILLLTSFSGREAISELFHFHLELIAENGTQVPFDALLGQFVSFRLTLPGDDANQRYFHGICSRVSQGVRDEIFTSYRIEVVPTFWFLTRRTQSRTFQHISIPDILKQVLAGLDTDFQVQGTFHPRDYVAQYNETDFDFASRLMQEEGIFYFFRHTDKNHTMVLANTPSAHPEVTGAPSTVIYEEVVGEYRPEGRVTRWEKNQELRSGKYTLWDHCFELPHQHLDAEKTIQDSVATGTVEHSLKIGQNDKLEIYEYPGGYAQRFDGIDKGGGEQPADIQKIFEDNARTVGIRMGQEAVDCLTIRGESDAGHFTPGHTFTLDRHYDADGQYVLTSVEHAAELRGDYRSGGAAELKYVNRFTCIPIGMPFRPLRTTPRPVMTGPQTAVVVGPPGEEIFTDKYGRVKVQFHWDRQGQYNTDSSCWVRVGTPWAGKNWGMIHIPRIGQEVVVAFEHGDPDRPIIVGSVYNADMMPPYPLPAGKVISGIKSNSTKGGGGYNELVFDDTKGKELIRVHAQYDMDTTVEHDDRQTVHHNRTISVDGTHSETIQGDTTITVAKGKLTHKVADNIADYYVKKALTETYDDTQTTIVKKNIDITSSTGEITITAAKKITLHCGSSTITLDKEGNITLDGVNVKHIGSTLVKSSAPAVEAVGSTTAKMGVGSQTITCSTAKIDTTGSAITTAAVGIHELSGALIKIN